MKKGQEIIFFNVYSSYKIRSSTKILKFKKLSHFNLYKKDIASNKISEQCVGYKVMN